MGHVVRPHGLRGDVVVHLVTNRLERFEPGARLACSGPGAAARPDLPGQLEVVTARPYKHGLVVRFAAVDSVDAAERLRGAVLAAEPIDDPGVLFVHELIGCTVVDVHGLERGAVTAVEANPASDLLVLADGHLVPLRFVVGRSPGRVVVDAPDGLFD
ncbi:MAG: ribosome maturation factor RimM [Actinomycetota bacterium]|nr:ribosome maturation factor RimM [Actinomycetota bacterium]